MSLRAPPIKSVVFGSTGIVGETITSLLSKKGDIDNESKPFITTVSRSGSIPALAHLPGVTCKAGDAKDLEQTIALCQGAQVIYCCIGLPYNGATWEKDFPVIVESMLQAAAESGAVLVWIDNLYMFGPEAAKSGVPMKEKSQDFTAYGRKPALRARMDRTLLDAAESGRCKVIGDKDGVTNAWLKGSPLSHAPSPISWGTKSSNSSIAPMGTHDLTALYSDDLLDTGVAIVRASDFYGPGVRNSALGDSLFPKILKGTSAYLLGNPDVRHTYTYVPDLARAAVAVGEAGKDAWGRAWHCPNAPAQTTAEVLQLANSLAGNNKPASFVVLKGIMRAFLALFIPALREMPEMSFVWENDYLVDHADFATRFPDIVATPLPEGLKETIRWWRAQENA